MRNMCLQLLQLLLKASQDKRFVCEEAEKSLEVMTTWMSPQPLLQKLQPYVKHFNPRVRAKASVCFYNSVSRLVRSHLHCLYSAPVSYQKTDNFCTFRFWFSVCFVESVNGVSDGNCK